MTNWFYYDNDGTKQGPVTDGQLKGLAKQDIITPETIIETEEGKTVPARKVKGLTFVEAVSTETSPPAVPAEPKITTWFYIDGNGKKQGPVTGGKLKGLAKTGMITPDTVVEAESGKTVTARKIKGLKFIEAAPPETPPTVEPSPFVTPPITPTVNSDAFNAAMSNITSSDPPSPKSYTFTAEEQTKIDIF